MNQKFLTDVLKFVEVGSATVKKAVDEVDVHRMAQKRASDLRPALLQHMLDSGVVQPAQKVAADAMLGSHAETLQLLKTAVDLIAELKQAASTKNTSGLGKATGEKTAGAQEGDYDSLTDPFVGRKTSEKKASDFALAKGAL